MDKTYEIERKYLVRELPDLSCTPFAQIEQAYISRDPVIRIRQMDDRYYLTVKAMGDVAIMREEYETEITFEQYESLQEKVESRIIKKTRYFIPFDTYTIELDIFDNIELILAEVEFADIESAHGFTPPDWFGKDVSSDYRYSNSYLAYNGG
jgi:CYTH domain-containing protein